MRVGRHLDASGMTHDGVEDVSRIVRGELGRSLHESLDGGGGRACWKKQKGVMAAFVG